MIINELDIELLLDLGHLVICVENMKIPLDSYLNDIPLNKISEIQTIFTTEKENITQKYIILVSGKRSCKI